MARETIWKCWALDVTTSEVAFVPVTDEGFAVFELAVHQERCPGLLIGIVSLKGLEQVQQWEAHNPCWELRYCSAADVTGDMSLLEVF
jgi:hypothetical protein